MAKNQTSPSRPTARLKWNNRSQTVTIPLAYQFAETVQEVFIHRKGNSVVLSPRPNGWSGFFSLGLKASDDFMSKRERLPVQESTY
jgi:antitoxin VapB